MLDYPTQIETLSHQLADLNEALANARDQADIAEAHIILEVLTTKDEATGKPLFSNESARAAALTLRLESDADFQTFTAEKRAHERRRAELMARLEALRGQFRLYCLEQEQQTALILVGASANRGAYPTLHG